MFKFKTLTPVLLLGLLVTGCATSTITRLTPRQTFRSADGLYPVEAVLYSDQQSLRWDSIEANVIVGSQTYPMHLTPLMTNRWETLIPIPPNTDTLEYRFKFDYLYNAWGVPPQDGSTLSKVYKLKITDQQQ
jgi:hypothetical protein